jgi:hypothetical protein
MSVSVIEQAKIQAQVLLPLVKALQSELGEARANDVKLTRTQTIMQGASHCDFRYSRTKKAD